MAHPCGGRSIELTVARTHLIEVFASRDLSGWRPCAASTSSAAAETSSRPASDARDAWRDDGAPMVSHPWWHVRGIDWREFGSNTIS